MLLPPILPAQQKMTPEEEAVYRDMVKRMGGDPDKMMQTIESNDKARKWTDAKAVHYAIVGVYSGRAQISGEPGKGVGYADVTDRVVISLDWNLPEARLVGTPSIQNAKSNLKNLRNPEPGCSPPILNGEYEHYELLGVKNGLGGALALQVQTNQPEIQVAQACRGSRKTLAAARPVRQDDMALPSPLLLDKKPSELGAWKLSADKKSLSSQKDGWTWTFTPSVPAQ